MYCSPTRGCEDTVLCCTVLLLWCNDPEIPEFLTANHKPFSGQPGNRGTFCKGMFFHRYSTWAYILVTCTFGNKKLSVFTLS